MVEKVKVKENNQVSATSVLGYLIVGVAIFDFASSWMGYNMTAFLGEASRFSAIGLGLLGSVLINAGSNGSGE